MNTYIIAQPFLGEFDKYYYFYKIINKNNNKFYYGVHETFNLNDNYSGSGILLRKSYKKYGIDKFDKYILHFFSTRIDMYNFEKNIVNESLVNNSDCYNCTNGGEKPPSRKGKKSMKWDGNNYVGVSKGLMWIKRESECIKIYKCDWNKYKSDGWVEGRILKTPKNNKPSLGKKIINNGIVNKYISYNLLNLYLNNGWILGKITKLNLKNTIWVHKGDQQKLIDKNNINDYISNGWDIGMNYKSRKNHIYINKDGVTKSINSSDINKYLDDGWVKGRYSEKKIHINKNGVNKMVNESEIESYLIDGWVKGSKLRYANNTVLMTKDNKSIRVPIDEVSEYIKTEWTPSKNYIKKMKNNHKQQIEL